MEDIFEQKISPKLICVTKASYNSNSVVAIIRFNSSMIKHHQCWINGV